MAFVLRKIKGKLVHINIREEHHGDEVQLACDVKLRVDVPNKFLDDLSPGLCAAIYTAEGAKQAELDDHPTVLRFPQLAPMKWAVGIVKGEITIHGTTKDENLAFECDVEHCTLAAKEGGTVELTFQAAVHPTPEESGQLSGLLGHDVKVSVKPIEQPAQPPVE